MITRFGASSYVDITSSKALTDRGGESVTRKRRSADFRPGESGAKRNVESGCGTREKIDKLSEPDA